MNEQYERRDSGLMVPKAQELLVGGKYVGQIIRNGKVVDEFEDFNLVTNEGLNSLLNVGLNGATQLTAWYLGLFQGNYTPVSTDTAAVIAGNSTESSSYAGTTRPQWIPVAASGQSITNSAARASYTFNASVTIYGAFLISSAVIGGSTGALLSAARFTKAKPVVANDQLLLTYTLSAASA
jgi:hypothetical protein